MSYRIAIHRMPPFALFDLKGDASALKDWCRALPAVPETPNRLIRLGAAELCHIGPSKWLLRAPLSEEDTWQADLRPEDAPPEISIVRVSDTLTFFRLTGPDAESVAAIGCPLDLHEDKFGPDAVSFTEFFGCKALVLRANDGLDIAVEQSFGTMIADYLNRATA